MEEEVKPLEPHQVRVLNERDELDDKRQKLSDFMQGDVFPKLSAIDQGLLMVQLAAMDMYSKALHERIELFY